jgi:hypothetical protein
MPTTGTDRSSHVECLCGQQDRNQNARGERNRPEIEQVAAERAANEVEGDDHRQSEAELAHRLRPVLRTTAPLRGAHDLAYRRKQRADDEEEAAEAASR